jgi:dipeptidase E
MARLLLASRGIPDLAAVAGARGRRAVLVPDAADPLDDPAIPAEVERELRRADFDVAHVTLAASTAQQVRSALNAADVIAVSGGDPFHLLVVARRVGFGDVVRSALQAGAVYIGYSAGAMLAGPTLHPLSLTSPFTPPPGLELAGLGLVDVLVLPHDDHGGRHDRHLAAQAAFGQRVRLITLRDGDVFLHDDGHESVLRR